MFGDANPASTPDATVHQMTDAEKQVAFYHQHVDKRIAVVIAGLFMEPVCRAVERRWYPHLPPARPAGLLVQGWDGLVVGLQLLGLTLISLMLALFLPGAGHLVGWLVTAWAVGRGLFSAVAMRRMDRRSALAFYGRIRWAVLAQGALLTLGGTVPLLNLLLPVVGTAAMVHLMQFHFHKSDTWG